MQPWVVEHPRLAIIAAAAVARAVPSLTLDRGLFFDVEAHWWIGSLVLAGRNVYTAPLAYGRYPYPPLHGYISALMVWLSGQNRTAFLAADKLIPAACGVGIALAVWAIALRLGMSHRQAVIAGLLYALNPLPVLVTAYHGQFEEIPLLGITLAYLCLAGERRSLAATLFSALLLGVAVAYKTWPLLFLPPLFFAVRGSIRRLFYLPLTLFPLAVSIGIYGLAFGLPAAREALARLRDYSGATNFCWGYVAMLHSCWIQHQAARPNAWVVGLNSKLLIVALLAVGALLLWRRRPLEGMVAIPLAFLLFTPGWGPNYSVWALPFALLLGMSLGMSYTLAMLPAVALIYLDSLYASYAYNDFSWTILKPLEAALGFVAWLAVALLLIGLYLPAGQRRFGVVALPEATAS